MTKTIVKAVLILAGAAIALMVWMVLILVASAVHPVLVLALVLGGIGAMSVLFDTAPARKQPRRW
jgi:hypothetical protein